jgi:hypothetical protein
MRDTDTRPGINGSRTFPVSTAAALLAGVLTVLYVRRHASAGRNRTVPGRSEWGRAARQGTVRQPSGLRPAPDFIEVGPDQYKQASAASDADVEVAMNRLLREAAVHAQEAAESAGAAGAYGTLTTVEPELVARADALKAEAEALRSYLELRQQRS